MVKPAAQREVSEVEHVHGASPPRLATVGPVRAARALRPEPLGLARMKSAARSPIIAIVVVRMAAEIAGTGCLCNSFTTSDGAC